MTQNSNKQNFWQKYKYIILVSLLIPVGLLAVRALRPNQATDKNPVAQTDKRKGTKDNTQANNTTASKNNKNTPTVTDTLPKPPKKDSVADNTTNKKNETPVNKGSARKLTAGNPYTNPYTNKLAQRKKAIPANVHFYYPPNGKKSQPVNRKLTAPSPVKKVVKKTYKVEVLPEPKAEILSDKVTIYTNIELDKTLVDRKITKDANGLVKKVYKTKKGKIGEVEMELWILARHWKRNDGRMINKIYCSNENGKLSLHNLVDGRLYLEPFLNDKKALFGALQQMPKNASIEILETQKKKYKDYNDHYDQYTWFKIKVKGYIKWVGNTNKKEDNG